MVFGDNFFKKFQKVFLIFLIAIVFTSLGVFWFIYSPTNKLEIDFLDVGQGDATLIKTPSGQNILIDGGPDNNVIAKLSENMFWWDKQIDLMILTHPHDDHLVGLIDVIKRYRVKKILYTGVKHSSPAYLEWRELIQEKKIPTTIITHPQTINFSENCYLDILYPEESFLNKEVSNLNNSSIVSKLFCKEKYFLFTGDAETEIEEELVKKNIILCANILQVGHHGSDTSSSKDFLQAVGCSDFKAIVSAGKDNDFGHPSRRILKRLERAGASVYETEKQGTIKFYFE